MSHAHARSALVDMPPVAEPTTGECDHRAHRRAAARDPDRDAWLRRLRESGASYLLVMKRDPARRTKTSNPPELAFASADPSPFVRAYDDPPRACLRFNW